MWKSIGVVGLWALLIAVLHVGSSSLQVSSAGVAPLLTAPTEDPGDPLREAPSPIHGSFATIHLGNDLGKAMSLVEARLTMDGQELPPVAALAPGDDVVVFSGRVAAGHHVSVPFEKQVGIAVRANELPKPDSPTN